MQTPEDENTYLHLDFEKKENENGSLILDTDSQVGIGTWETGYAVGDAPSTNLIIHGHNMRSGLMFGDLPLYESEAYGKDHSCILFDSLYEQREYELISVFHSQVFKFYQFFQADTREEFADWYEHIKQLSLYDTGVNGGAATVCRCADLWRWGMKKVVILTRPADYRKTPKKAALAKIVYKKYPEFVRQLQNRAGNYNRMAEEVQRLE